RAPRVPQGEPFAAVSRETLLLLNNVFLSVACAMVLIGTLAPLVLELFGHSISVGPPYYGLMFVLLTAPLVLLLPWGPLTRWRAEALAGPVKALLPAGAAALVLAMATLLLLSAPARAVVGLLGGAWVIGGTLAFLWRRKREGRLFTREMVGMALAHAGVGVFVIGVLVTESTSIERDVAMAPGETVEVAGYAF